LQLYDIHNRVKNKTMENLTKPEIKRLYSIDALRGFDMFWIMGGEGIFIGLTALTGCPVLQWWADQQHMLPSMDVPEEMKKNDSFFSVVGS